MIHSNFTPDVSTASFQFAISVRGRIFRANNEQLRATSSSQTDICSSGPEGPDNRFKQAARDKTNVAGSTSQSLPCHRFLLWIDGVGVWQLLMGTRFVIGAPSTKLPEADLAIQANVRKQHAVIRASSEDWILEPLADCLVGNQPVDRETILQSGDQLRLNETVELGFRIPSPLSHSAVIDLESGHQPLQRVDGVLLLTDHCIVGPRRDQHVYCPTWPHSFVLFRREEKLLCRSSGDFQCNGKPVEDFCEIDGNTTLESDDCRFRIEVL